MALGYSKPLYLLAFDHRGSFGHDLFAAPHPIPDEARARITDAKEVIYEGFVAATGRGVPCDAAGILVDEQYGLVVAAIQALQDGFDGFAIGRTLWEEPLRGLIAGTTGRSAAVREIADHYLETVSGFAAGA
jgi:myo-inositol catabolism protein IolC